MRKCFASLRLILSRTFCLASRFTTPGNTQYSTAFRMIPRFDLVVGCLYNFGPIGWHKALVKYLQIENGEEKKCEKLILNSQRWNDFLNQRYYLSAENDMHVIRKRGESEHCIARHILKANFILNCWANEWVEECLWVCVCVKERALLMCYLNGMQCNLIWDKWKWISIARTNSKIWCIDGRRVSVCVRACL